MLIPIKRYYISSQLTAEILINTHYIIRIEPITQEDNERGIPINVMSRIIYDGFDNDSKIASVMYSLHSVTYFKGLVTRQRNLKEKNSNQSNNKKK